MGGLTVSCLQFPHFLPTSLAGCGSFERCPAEALNFSDFESAPNLGGEQPNPKLIVNSPVAVVANLNLRLTQSNSKCVCLCLLLLFLFLLIKKSLKQFELGFCSSSSLQSLCKRGFSLVFYRVSINNCIQLPF